MTDRVLYLRAQQRDLERMIAEADPDDVTRIGFEHRLDAVREELEREEAIQGSVAEVTLHFRGAPVDASRGIEATFASKSVESFQKIVSKMAASRSGREIGARGPIPGAADSRLFITGTARGSFGLVLRELGSDRPLVGRTTLAEAVESTIRLLARAASSDEELADAAMETDPAVLDELDVFLAVVGDRGATLRVVTAESKAVLDDPDTVAAARERTHHRRVDREQAPVHGTLLGVLPESGWFELRTGSGEVIRGRLGAEADRAEAQELVFRRVIARITTLTIATRGRETRRYVLENIEADLSAPAQ